MPSTYVWVTSEDSVLVGTRTEADADVTVTIAVLGAGQGGVTVRMSREQADDLAAQITSLPPAPRDNRKD